MVDFFYDGRFWGQCAFVSTCRNFCTGSSGVPQQFIRLSVGREGTLHSVYFSAGGVKAHTVFPLDFHKKALLSQLFVSPLRQKMHIFLKLILRERERKRMQVGGGATREGEIEAQAGSKRSVRSSLWGLIPGTTRS